MTPFKPGEMGPLGRKMFFRIENETGRDKCAFCSTSMGALVKHMATGKNLCPACIGALTEKMEENAEPMHQPTMPLSILLSQIKQLED